MSTGNPEGFPWGSNCPERKQRLAVAIAIASLGAVLLRGAYLQIPNFHSDFEPVWFGASALIHGGNPYALIGPGRAFEWPWPLLYPATALIPAMPLAFLSGQAASATFVWLSTFALAYGITARSWHLLPLFASASFLYASRQAQWSVLTAAALFIPIVASLFLAKPQVGFPVLMSATRRLTLRAAIVGGTGFFALSLILLPGWPQHWLPLVARAGFSAPISWPAGPVILLVLFRWKRPEAWLVLTLAALPQTAAWYSALVLLTVARTYREACVLSLVSTAGIILSDVFTNAGATFFEALLVTEACIVVFCFLPAVISVVRRPNEGEMPLWLRFAMARWPSGSAVEES